MWLSLVQTWINFDRGVTISKTMSLGTGEY